MGWWRLGKMVDCRPLTAHPVAMATKPNQNGTGTASNGRQPHHQKFYPFYPVLPPAVLIYSSYCRAFSYTKEKRKRVGGGDPWHRRSLGRGRQSTATESTVAIAKTEAKGCIKMRRAWESGSRKKRNYYLELQTSRSRPSPKRSVSEHRRKTNTSFNAGFKDYQNYLKYCPISVPTVRIRLTFQPFP